MTDKPTQKEMEDLFVEETGFDPDDFPAAIFGFTRAALVKWGQPAQAAEPVAVVVPCYTPSGKRVALYSAKQDLPIGTKLYTAPQPSPAAQGDAIEHELAMLIRRIVSSARRNCQDGSNVLKLANEAWAYLVRKGLVGSPLRDAGIESDPTPAAQAADRAIEGCPELNMGNYDEVDVERLNDWAIRAHEEIDRLHALAAGQATAQQVAVAGESLVEWAMRATPEEFNTANWGVVHKGLLRARKELEITGVVHSWIGPYIDIARQESMKVAAPAQPAVQQAHYEEQPDGTTIPIDPSEMAPQQGAAYAALPAKYYLVGGVVKTWDEDQMCDFTDRTHAIRASRGQAPSQEDSVQEDAARYRWLRNKSQVVHNKAWFGGMSVRNHYGDFLCRDDALAALDTAIDADRKQGATQ